MARSACRNGAAPFGLCCAVALRSAIVVAVIGYFPSFVASQVVEKTRSPAEAVTNGGQAEPETEPSVPYLTRLKSSGPNDVRDILVIDDGFLVATGTAIIRYQYDNETPNATAVYTTAD